MPMWSKFLVCGLRSLHLHVFLKVEDELKNFLPKFASSRLIIYGKKSNFGMLPQLLITNINAVLNFSMISLLQGGKNSKNIELRFKKYFHSITFFPIYSQLPKIFKNILSKPIWKLCHFHLICCPSTAVNLAIFQFSNYEDNIGPKKLTCRYFLCICWNLFSI